MRRSLAFVFGLAGISLAQNQSENEAKNYLDHVNKEFERRVNKVTLAEWNYETNLTDENLATKLAANADLAKFYKSQWKETIKFPWKTYRDEDVKRQFQKLSVLGTAALPDEKFTKLEKTVAEMSEIYSKAKICAYNKTNDACELSLEPHLTTILASSRSEEELRHVWVEWRKATGDKIRSKYPQYVNLSNEAAILNNFTDTSEHWLHSYETEDFQEQLSKLWEQLKPFYEQLHAYIRRKLRLFYGEKIVGMKTPIPAHLLGNMWGQTWSNLLDIALPYPSEMGNNDVTDELVKQNYDAYKMFKLAEEFFTSVNLSAMPATFWEKSVLEKPEDRELVCHASAWDFQDSKDFRIKQCTEITHEDLMTAHHEMGHIQYYIQYKDQPYVYREGANPGFHEAIGDTISLSVSTSKHLNKVGLLRNYKRSEQREINDLFKTALDKIAFLPFAYAMDLWRWDVFRGAITEEQYNCHWWKLSNEYQGLQPPVDRDEKNFDPGSKYHIVASVPYIRYFVSFIIQFQFHEAACKAAGEYEPNNPDKPLHRCDIYQSAQAGNLLRKMLSMGSSKSWQDAMEEMTGQREMDAGPLVRYFAPIHEWLKRENERSGEYIGWQSPTTKCEGKYQIRSSVTATLMDTFKGFFSA